MQERGALGRASLKVVNDEAKCALEALVQLPGTEHAALASGLEESVGCGSSLEEIEAAWIAEAERRREDLQAGRTSTISWEDVRREIFDMVERPREP